MDLTGARWRKSSFSGGNGESCVEVAFLPGGLVAVRDTKGGRPRHEGPYPAPHLYSAAEWAAFVAGVRGRGVRPSRGVLSSGWCECGNAAHRFSRNPLAFYRRPWVGSRCDVGVGDRQLRGR
ncbi:MAG: DUF397 domain-containing protein [Pseudonocardia sp.]